MDRKPIEPGLFSLFRVFAALTFAFMLLSVVIQAATSRNHIDPLNLILITVTLVLLSVPGLRQRYPHQVLNASLFMATGTGLLGQISPNQHYEDAALLGDIVTLRILGALLWLLLPALLVAWQYRNLHVILYAALTYFGSVALLHHYYGAEMVTRGMVLSVLGFRTITLLVAGLMITRLMQGQREQRHALTEANTKISYYAATLDRLATTRERNRIARELHDTLAHTLSAVAVQLEAVDALWNSSPEQARERLARSIAETRSGLAETRRVLEDLRASPLEDLGLELAVRNLAETTAMRGGFKLELQLQGQFVNLSPAVEQAVYRIAQEALANVDLHAHARLVSLRLSHFPPDLVLRISDDGDGFDVAEAEQLNRYGIRGMRERAEMIGAELKVESRPGEGTAITLIAEVLS